ncbi:thioredoxin [Rhodotorula taiwanensis]|uniref:Thioredoxin n=1 Tax=Rhodotorula taiwanensis TaxID=741276 RepID=A0A2S5B1K9_9BASI|nr:thioredoxin [Rhodotorula taiwanensis]
MVTVIDSLETFKTVIGGDKLVIIDFWATCKVISPVFEKLEAQYPNIGFYKCDVDEQEAVAAEVGVKAMPTFYIFKSGEKMGSIVGADPNKLKAGLEHHNATNA